MGLEVPVVCEPIVPGDRFRVGLTYQMQLAPMMNPVYDGLEVNFEAFFVPNRIIDKRWKEFWTGYNDYDQMTPSNLAPLTINRLTVGDFVGEIFTTDTFPNTYNKPIGIGSLMDFLGVQFCEYYPNGYPKATSEVGSFLLEINALPFLAYSRIFDDWYRNERVQKARLFRYYNEIDSSERSFDLNCYYDAEEEDYTDSNLIPVMLFKRNYKKDRFTTALPEPIIGGDVHIPVNPSKMPISTLLGNPTSVEVETYDGDFANVVDARAYSSLNALALGTIEQLKLAFKEYSYRMKDTYNGNRYVESIESHYGIRVPDSTLQRSYYLGSSRDYVNFGEVYQTSSGDGQGENGSLGDYAGRGTAAGTNFLFDETFYEHGFMFVLMCVNPISRYFQGIKRMFTRFDRSDYFEPEFQNIGDDFIETKELYHFVDDLSEHPDYVRVFGYNSRWIDMKSRYNELHGEFANPYGSLFSWNFARSFASEPTISIPFSEINPINKPFVSTDKRIDNYFVDVAIDMQALRPVLAVESF